MARGKAEDAGGLTPAKDDNAALCHFGRRTLPIFKCVDYITAPAPKPGSCGSCSGRRAPAGDCCTPWGRSSRPPVGAVRPISSVCFENIHRQSRWMFL